ncbi:MAG: hypothetical protein RL701_1191, partial [Pseudomonadota bacterium]
MLAVVSAACADDTNDTMAAAGSGGGASNGGGAGAAATVDYNGCAAANYSDRSDSSAERIVVMGGSGLVYTPKCMRIAVGQSVSWTGSFLAHPLAPGNPQDSKSGSASNPIQPTATGQSAEFTFSKAGTYPYYCTLHGLGTGQGMAGVIDVR